MVYPPHTILFEKSERIYLKAILLVIKTLLDNELYGIAAIDLEDYEAFKLCIFI